MDLCKNETECTATTAILLYERKVLNSRREVAFASIHTIDVEDGKPVYGPGTPLTKNALEKALQSLAVESGIDGLAWIEDEVIATGQGIHVWWTPAQKRFMYFESSGLTRAGEAMNPPLVWIEYMGDLHVYALQNNRKPGPDTELFDAPLYNVYQDGKVCTGSMNRGQFAQTKLWVDGFYRSSFNHANPSDRKLTTSRLSNTSLWSHLMDHPNKEFPVKYLIPFGATLRQVISAIRKF